MTKIDSHNGKPSMADATEHLQVLQQLGRTYRAFLNAYEKQVGHCLPRWRVMLYLYTEQCPCPQKRLGDASHMDPGALSRQLAMLETLGWIARATDERDKRITNVSLTKEGKEQVERSLPKRTVFIKRTFGDVPDAQLRRLMDDLLLLETRFNSAGKQQTVPEDSVT